jgi:adenylosuccinate synthase
MNIPRVTVITDLQFGSVGKGSVAEYYSRNITHPDTIAVGFSSNAGHSSYTFGRKMVHSVIPNGLDSPNLKRIMIGPGAVIDSAKLEAELSDVPDGVEVVMHEAACLITEDAIAKDKVNARIGSTQKGCGPTAVAKINRDKKASPLVRDIWHSLPGNVWVADTVEWQLMMMDSKTIMVEGHQGYSLGPNQGFWPHCTFRDCTTHQLLVDAGVPGRCNLDRVIGVARTFPIRVANRPEGTSGDCYPDQYEIEWDTLGREPELTTVTQLPRRIFTFSWEQFRQAVVDNGCTETVLTFADYLADDYHDQFLQEFRHHSRDCGAEFAMATYGYKGDSDYVVQK